MVLVRSAWVSISVFVVLKGGFELIVEVFARGSGCLLTLFGAAGSLAGA